MFNRTILFCDNLPIYISNILIPFLKNNNNLKSNYSFHKQILWLKYKALDINCIGTFDAPHIMILNINMRASKLYWLEKSISTLCCMCDPYHVSSYHP